MKVVTSVREYMRLAHICGRLELEAERTGKRSDREAFAAAEKEFEAYRTLCLEADEMTTGLTVGELYYGR